MINLKLMGVLVAGSTLVGSANALVSLEFRPLNQNVALGSTVDVELWATTTLASEDFVAVDTILVWTDSILNPISAGQGGGAYNSWTTSGFLNNELNQSLSDGNALWTGLAPLVGTVPSATPSGLKLTTFSFTANQVGVATLSMPASYTWPGRPLPFESKVYGPQLADLTGNLAATATINVVPEPASMAILGLGIAAFARRRKRA